MNINQILRRILNEATSDSSGGRGSYVAPLEPGVREFKKIDLQPFTIPVSKYNDAMLGYDSYDGSMSLPKKETKKIESKARKISNYIKNHPNSTFSDDDGNVINQTPGKNLKIVPIKENTISEDLAVWFGTKKKPKGSKQPKGPWVDICRKVNGKHPPCGRHDADKGSYPKCRAAGVAGKMTDSEKKSACQQKRNAEKKDTQTGKGQKPIMTSYKPRTNENMRKKIVTLTENDLVRIVKRVLKEGQGLPTGRLDLFCLNYKNGQTGDFIDMVAQGTLSNTQYGKGFGIVKNENSPIPSDNISGSQDDSEYITIEKPTDVLKEYLSRRFPEIDFEKTDLKNLLYIKNFIGSQGVCKATDNTDSEWINFFESNGVAYNIPII